MKTTLSSVVLIAAALFMGLITFTIGTFMWGFWYDEWSGYNSSQYVSDGFCNIGVATVHGDIMTTPDPEYVSTTPAAVRSFLKNAENDEYIQGVLVEIDSPGGSPAASAAIAEELQNTTLPNAALIGDYGLSGGYLIASAADHIIASPFADVGSIGVTMSYLSNVEKNQNEGITYVPLSSAPFKDSGSPDKELTEEERARFERDLTVFHDEFVKTVAQNRALSVEEVARLADGSSLPSSLALEEKLIDAIGTRKTAKTYFAEQLGITEEEVLFCEPIPSTL